MLLVLFALSASAQPAVYGAYYGAGTSVPQPVYAVAPPRAVPVAPYSGPTQFALRQADSNVRLSEADLLGNKFAFNYLNHFSYFGDTSYGSLGTSPFLVLGPSFLADSAAQQEAYFQREINHLRATTPRLTRDDRDKIDDFALQREYARQTKIRRGAQTMDILSPDSLATPGLLGPFSSIYDIKAKDAGLVLAQNQLVDARRAYQAEPSRENAIALRNAQDNIDQASARQKASSFDFLGGLGSLSSDPARYGLDYIAGPGILGPFNQFGGVLRKKASESKLDVGLRNLRLAREKYAQDPSEDNRFDLQLANLFVKATEEEDDTNQNEVTYNFLVDRALDKFVDSGDTPSNGLIAAVRWNEIGLPKNTEDESRLWLRYAKLQRQKLYRQAQRGLQGEPSGSDSTSTTGPTNVQQQMLGLSMYGPRQGAY